MSVRAAGAAAGGPDGGRADPLSGDGRGAFGPPAVLAFCVAAAGYTVVACSALVLLGHTQKVQFALYLLGIAITVSSILTGLALWGRLIRNLGPATASGAVALAAGTLAGSLICCRLAAATGSIGANAAALTAFGIWAIAWGALAMRPRALSRARLGSRREVLWLLAAAALAAALPAFVVIESIALVPTLCTLIALGGLIVLSARWRPRVPRTASVAIDLLIVVAIALAAVDVVAYVGADFGTVIRLPIHQDFLLGPANDVLGGRGVLTETASQYGVGSIYALDAWFLIAPIGYGTMSLLNGLLLALAWGTVYVILRLAGSARLLAGVVVGLGLIGTVISLYPFPVSWPQIGPLRFGLPLPVILLEALAARTPEWQRVCRLGSVAVLSLSAIWSLETFLYTALTFAAILAWQEAVSTGTSRERTRHFANSLGLGLLACVGAHLLFAMATLLATGELPDWGTYLAFFKVQATSMYLPGYLFPDWPLGLGVGMAYLASAIGLTMIALRRPEVARAHPVTLLALTGATAYGAGTLTYAVGRAPSLPYVLTGTFLLAGLWLGLVLVAAPSTLRSGRWIALAIGAWCAALLVGASSATFSQGWDRSALGHALPGGEPLVDAASRLWDSPPLSPLAPEADRLLAEAIPGSGPALVLAAPDLTVETLMRSGRVNVLPVGYAPQDDLLRSRNAPRIAAAVAALPAGTRMLTQTALLDAPRPADPLAGVSNLDQQPVPLQRYALALIEDRFEMRVVARGSGDLVVVELRPRRP